MTYVAPEVIELDQIAMLPITTGPGLEGFRRLTADSISAAIQQAYPTIEVVPAGTAGDRLSNAGLTSAYAQLVTDYETTGILDARRLARITEAVESEYLMHVQLEYDGRGSEQSVTLLVRLWGAPQRDIVWEAVAEARSLASDFELRREVRDLLGSLTPKLAESLPFFRAPAGTEPDPDVLADLPRPEYNFPDWTQYLGSHSRRRLYWFGEECRGWYDLPADDLTWYPDLEAARYSGHDFSEHRGCGPDGGNAGH